MPAKKSTAKKAVTRDAIISNYMNRVLETEKQPRSVFKFCKEHNIKEEEFYNFFGSFEGLRKEIWNSFFDHTMALNQKSKEYQNYNNQEKMLTLFYTLFELLTANRSYVLFALNEEKDLMRNMAQLSGLRHRVKEFATELIEERNDEKQLKIFKHPAGVFSEGAWLQTLFLLKYWMEDSSPSFEKTDAAIEKSVRAIFDVFETSPLESIVDFGKFLWKERMN